MRTGFCCVRVALVVVAVCLIGAASAEIPDDDVINKVKAHCDTIKDVQFVAERTAIDRDELEKINKDFAAMFRLVRMELAYKAPEKIRIDAKVGPAKVLLVVSGDTKYLKAPFKEDRDDLKKYPNKRQSALDFGLVPGQAWLEWNARRIPDKKMEGADCYALKLTHKSGADPDSQVLYFDKATLKMVAREKYDEEGKLKLRNRYRNHKKFADAWLPQEVIVENQAGKFGASLELKQFKVNKGIDSSLFRIP